MVVFCLIPFVQMSCNPNSNLFIWVLTQWKSECLRECSIWVLKFPVKNYLNLGKSFFLVIFCSNVHFKWFSLWFHCRHLNWIGSISYGIEWNKWNFIGQNHRQFGLCVGWTGFIPFLINISKCQSFLCPGSIGLIY